MLKHKFCHIIIWGFVSVNLWAQPYSLEEQAFRQKYALAEKIDWQHALGSTSKQVQDYLQANKYQEAIWLLEEQNEWQKAQMIKKFLRTVMEHGPIPSGGVTDLGMGGITKPKKVLLPYGVIGVFKAKSFNPAANYKAEIAAYLFDQLGRFKLVPLTVERRIGDKVGSLQYFVADTEPAGKDKSYKRGPTVCAFDYIISNKDRNGFNILKMKNGREVAIDHGVSLRGFNFSGKVLDAVDYTRHAFGTHVDPVRFEHIHPKTDSKRYVIDRTAYQALSQLQEADLERELGGYLPQVSLKKTYKKLQRFLGLLSPHYKD